MSSSGGILFASKFAKLAEENPDLNFRLIREILIGLAELDQLRYRAYEYD